MPAKRPRGRAPRAGSALRFTSALVETPAADKNGYRDLSGLIDFLDRQKSRMNSFQLHPHLKSIVVRGFPDTLELDVVSDVELQGALNHENTVEGSAKLNQQEQLEAEQEVIKEAINNGNELAARAVSGDVTADAAEDLLQQGRQAEVTKAVVEAARGPEQVLVVGDEIERLGGNLLVPNAIQDESIVTFFGCHVIGFRLDSVVLIRFSEVSNRAHLRAPLIDFNTVEIRLKNSGTNAELFARDLHGAKFCSATFDFGAHEQIAIVRGLRPWDFVFDGFVDPSLIYRRLVLTSQGFLDSIEQNQRAFKPEAQPPLSGLDEHELPGA